ncbi:MAG: hypothetical protein LBU65_13430 [Planctomycetaceae bacterium]|jgi:hypothetical protein|nr:hypothetical protein [Planctomycetaceae bacterium]
MRKKVGEEWIEKQTWFEVCVYCKNLNGQRKQHRRQSFAFAYYGVSFGKAKDFLKCIGSVSALNRVIVNRIKRGFGLAPSVILFCVVATDAELLAGF